MKIALLGDHLLAESISMKLYIKSLYLNLRKKNIDATIILPPNFFGQIKIKKLKKYFIYIDKFIIFILILPFKTYKYDVIHVCDQANALYIFLLNKKKTLLTCFDLIFLSKFYDKYEKKNLSAKLYQFLLRYFIKKYYKIISVSNFTKKEIKQIISKKLDITTIYLWLNDIFSFYRNKNININFQTPFFICFNTAFYKNFNETLKIFNNLVQKRNFFLYCYGNKPDFYQQKFISANNLKKKIFFIKNIEQKNLICAYKQSTGLIFPSIIEGFGLPIIECQYLKTRVFASEISVLKEIGSNNVKYFKLNDPKKASLKILNELKKNKKILRKNIYQYQIKNIIIKYIDIYKSIYKFKN